MAFDKHSLTGGQLNAQYLKTWISTQGLGKTLLCYTEPWRDSYRSTEESSDRVLQRVQRIPVVWQQFLQDETKDFDRSHCVKENAEPGAFSPFSLQASVFPG